MKALQVVFAAIDAHPFIDLVCILVFMLACWWGAKESWAKRKPVI